VVPRRESGVDHFAFPLQESLNFQFGDSVHSERSAAIS
jgi:hypothetical protein